MQERQSRVCTAVAIGIVAEVRLSALLLSQTILTLLTTIALSSDMRPFHRPPRSDE